MVRVFDPSRTDTSVIFLNKIKQMIHDNYNKINSEIA